MSNRNLKPIDQLHPSAKRSVKQLLSTDRRWSKYMYATPDNTAISLAGAINTVYGDDTDAANTAERKIVTAIRKFTKKGRKAPGIEAFNKCRTRSFNDIKTIVTMAGV
jgi:hypothetical protein